MDFIKKMKDEMDEVRKEYGQAPNNPNGPKKRLKKFLWIPLILICIFAVTTCAYTVQETEQAILLTLGKVSSVEPAGLHFKAPWPFQTVTKVDFNKTQKLQIGYSAENERNPEAAIANKLESKMITGDFNIVNVDFFIEWKISDPVKYKFSADEPKVILKNIALASARSIIGSKNVDGVLTTEKSVIEVGIMQKVIEKLKNYDIGVQVLAVKIQDSEPPTAEVRDAFKAVETAKQEKETYINTALSYKNEKLPLAQSDADKLVREAESFKQSRINAARGEVAKFNEMYKEYAKNAGITKTRMYLETIEKILPGIPVYIDTTSDGVQKMLPLKDFVNNKEGGN